MIKQKSDNQNEISIGTLAEATGLGVERIRMWERRYGYPRSVRRPSGHRRYPVEEIKRLIAIKRALDLGFRTGDIAKASLDELEKLVNAPTSEPVVALPVVQRATTTDPQISAWVQYAKHLDESRLTNEFYQSWSELGALKFITQRVIPFLRALAEARELGKISESEEHFTSERIGDFLSTMWRQMNGAARGSTVVLASLPGDIHRLGLQMCACVIALANRRVVFIGASSPIDEVVKTVKKAAASAVCVSITNALTKTHAKDCLLQLLKELPRQLNVVIGGEGSIIADEIRKSSAYSVIRITDFEAFFDWINRET